jgi:cobalt/nickel transport system permease protein
MLPELKPDLPGWMKAESTVQPPPFLRSRVSKKQIEGFAEKTIHSILELVRQAVFSDRISQQPGLLQKLDPRTKIVLTVGVLLTISLLHRPWLLLVIYFALLWLAVTSRIGFGLFLKRVWLTVPLYTAIVSLPVLSNWVSPGHPVWILHHFEEGFHWGPWLVPRVLAITDTGLHSVGLFVLRTGVSVSAGLLLTVTTPWQAVLRALRILGIPQFFVFSLGMTYRYIHLLLVLALDGYLARKSRVLRPLRWNQDQRWMAAQVSYLFMRSQNLAENVYNAMLSRGYQGEPKLLEELKWQRRDLLAATVGVSFCLSVLLAQWRM